MLTKLYSVHLNPRDARPYESATFVPEGFSMYAFFFHVLWALYHRLWLPAFIFTLLLTCSFYIGDLVNLSALSVAVIDLGIRLMIGMSANDLWRDALEKRGWITSDVVIADNMLEASRRYYDRYLAQIENAQALPGLPQHPDRPVGPGGGATSGQTPSSWSSRPGTSRPA